MMKYIITLLLIGNFSLAAEGDKHRGELVKVVSPTTIQVRENKKPITITLRGVSDKKLTTSQKQAAVKYLNEKLTGQVLIWQEFKDGAEVSPDGVGQISRSLLEAGLVNIDPKAPEVYKQFEEQGKNLKVGIWEAKK